MLFARKRKKNNARQKALLIKRRSASIALSRISTSVDWFILVVVVGILLAIAFISAFFTYQRSASVNALAAFETRVVTQEDELFHINEETYLKVIEEYENKKSRFDQLLR